MVNEKLAKDFSEYMKKFPELYDYLADLVKKNIPKSVKKPVIIDLGCGPGLLANSIFNDFKSAKIIGVDPSSKMLKEAQINNKELDFEPRLGSSDKIPASNKSVDLVVSRFSLTYWKKPKKSFSEIYRVLKPKRKIVLEFLNKDFPNYKLSYILFRMKFKSKDSGVVRYHKDSYKTAYSISSVKKLLIDSGFKIIYEEGQKKDWKYIFVAEKK